MRHTYLGRGHTDYDQIPSTFDYFLESDGAVFALNSKANYQEGLERYDTFLKDKNPPYVFCRHEKETVIIKDHKDNIEVWIHEQYKQGKGTLFPVKFTDYFDSLGDIMRFLDARWKSTEWEVSG